ncbi:MAG: hypothetical protein FJ296_08840 [Planctomycetes bacterium]|nr:hypothetical protein [Planctomycetota bacterium]
MTRATAADRWSAALRLLVVFTVGWVVVALLYLIPVANGAITLSGWAHGMALAPIAPLGAALVGDTTFPPAFTLPFALTPLALAAVAIWRADDGRWFRAAGWVLALWWLVLAVLMSVGV